MAGRPREFDRDTALQQARNLFWSRGYEVTSMSDLMAATGVASASLYAAFGGKEALFREAIGNYEAREGGFASRALDEEPTAYRAIERMLRDAVMLFTRRGGPSGCMVVTSTVNCSPGNDAVQKWLSDRRRARGASIAARLQAAVEAGELRPDTNVEALADCYATLLQGLSVQARDGIPRNRLLATVDSAMQMLGKDKRIDSEN
jgi:AcrR family transcriptional regulator